MAASDRQNPFPFLNVIKTAHVILHVEEEWYKKDGRCPLLFLKLPIAAGELRYVGTQT